VLCFSGPIAEVVVTVKLTPLLATPPTVTTTLPLVAPVGTGATMLVALQLDGVAAVPLKLTVLVPCVAPKFVPVIVTGAPANPDVGFKLVMLGAVLAAVTVKLMPLLATPPTVTTTFPVVAPAGTGATMLLALQLVGVAAVPLKLTVLVPCVVPKFAPAIVTELPTAPDAGLTLAMLGTGFPPPPGFEFATPPHPAIINASATNRRHSPVFRKISPQMIVFLARYMLLALPRLRPSILIGLASALIELHYVIRNNPSRTFPRSQELQESLLAGNADGLKSDGQFGRLLGHWRGWHWKWV
jgi:hypothetical protein